MDNTNFRPMRRKARELDLKTAKEWLLKAEYGVLAVLGDGGYPYAVPLNFVYADDAIYLHCAKIGHKIDAIQKDNRVSFCVVPYASVAPSKYTTMYESVIVFGEAEIVTDCEEQHRAAVLLSQKFACGTDAQNEAEYDRFKDALCIVKINITHITAKSNRNG